MKNNKGITLVALVITIIVLLILAGVSISMVVGENGVLNRATNAATTTSEAEMKQALEMAVDGAQGEFIDIWTKDQSAKIINVIVGTDGKNGTEIPTKKVTLVADGYYIKVTGSGDSTRTVTINAGETEIASKAKTATLTQSANGVGLSLTWQS